MERPRKRGLLGCLCPCLRNDSQDEVDKLAPIELKSGNIATISETLDSLHPSESPSLAGAEPAATPIASRQRSSSGVTITLSSSDPALDPVAIVAGNVSPHALGSSNSDVPFQSRVPRATSVFAPSPSSAFPVAAVAPRTRSLSMAVNSTTTSPLGSQEITPAREISAPRVSSNTLSYVPYEAWRMFTAAPSPAKSTPDIRSSLTPEHKHSSASFSQPSRDVSSSHSDSAAPPGPRVRRALSMTVLPASQLPVMSIFRTISGTPNASTNTSQMQTEIANPLRPRRSSVLLKRSEPDSNESIQLAPVVSLTPVSSSPVIEQPPSVPLVAPPLLSQLTDPPVPPVGAVSEDNKQDQPPPLPPFEPSAADPPDESVQSDVQSDPADIERRRAESILLEQVEAELMSEEIRRLRLSQETLFSRDSLEEEEERRKLEASLLAAAEADLAAAEEAPVVRKRQMTMLEEAAPIASSPPEKPIVVMVSPRASLSVPEATSRVLVRRHSDRFEQLVQKFSGGSTVKSPPVPMSRAQSVASASVRIRAQLLSQQLSPTANVSLDPPDLDYDSKSDQADPHQARNSSAQHNGTPALPLRRSASLGCSPTFGSPGAHKAHSRPPTGVNFPLLASDP